MLIYWYIRTAVRSLHFQLCAPPPPPQIFILNPTVEPLMFPLRTATCFIVT